MQKYKKQLIKQKKQPTLTKKVVLAWMAALIVSNSVIGTLSFLLYRNQLLEARAEEAKNVATAMAVRMDGDKFTEIMDSLEKNDYWYEVKAYADRIAAVFNTAFIYILDNDYTSEVTYFAEGAADEAPFDLGMTEIIEGVYADEMFVTLNTGNTTTTAPYPSGEYGNMVSGFAAITDKNGVVAGVVGVDFFYLDIQERLSAFAFSIIGIVLAFSAFLYIVMTYLGDKLAGKPLSELDTAARRIAAGDIDIKLNIRATSEIGRLANSFSSMAEGIKAQAAALEVLSQGDLTPRVQPRGEKDTMGIAIAKILDNLNDMFNEINRTAVQVSAGASQIANSAQSLAQGASEQSSAVENLSGSISAVTAKANESLEIADKANALAASIKSDAQVSSGHMDRMTLAVKDIANSSMSIGKVIKVIDDIAFQTNILALNAAVEAARAGQHGKGFAVVAEEVRNLAAKSAEAAKDTEHLISDSIEKARLGSAIADETAASLGRIIKGINECAVLVNGIANSFDEQIKTISDINIGIDQVSHVVQQNSAASEESAAASTQMSNQSNMLKEMVLHFKLRS